MIPERGATKKLGKIMVGVRGFRESMQSFGECWFVR
jgi:hypothetical protein